MFDALGVGVAGFEDERPEDGGETWTIEILHQGEPDRADLEVAIDQITAELGVTPVDLEIAPVPDVDWLAAVQTQFPPQRVGRFSVYGSQAREGPHPGLTPLKLDPGLAFGSGEHATTRACLTIIGALARRRRFKRVLDLGCGSGILAIAAAKCWPARVIAADNDPSAVEVARANARENGVGANVRTVLSDGFKNPVLRASGRYDLILANILADPLIELAPEFARVLARNGALVLSGLLIDQMQAIAAAFRAQGLSPVRLIEEGPWATLQFRRLRKVGRLARLRPQPARDRRADKRRRRHGARSFGARVRRRFLRER